MSSIFDLLASLESNKNLDSLKKVVRGAVLPHGYDRVVMFSISAVRDELIGGIYWMEGEWFVKSEAVDAQSYLRHCPMTRHVLETDQPFFWSKTTTDSGPQYRFVGLPRGPGVHGLQVPVFGHAGLIGAVSFGGKKIDSTSTVRLTLTQLGVTAFFAARCLLEPPQARTGTKLSERELEVLQWIASGRRIADIAATLGISGRTVENHLRRIRQRLTVETTAQAVTTALRSGAISM